MSPCRRDSLGFTLIELTIVVLIVGIAMSVAIPRLLPVLLSSNVEEQASHLKSYGPAAMAYAALRHERCVVKVDLDNQAYWAERWTDDEQGAESDERTPTRLFDDSDEKDATGMQDLPLSELLRDEGVSDEEKAQELRRRSDRFMQSVLEEQARNVESEGVLDDPNGFLKDVGPQFKKFTLDTSDKDADANVITNTLLTRVELSAEVKITRVEIGGEEHSSGVAEIEVLPQGLATEVSFVLEGGGDVYTICWDPITGGARMEEGDATRS